MIIENWLPKNKKAAVVFTIDDLHPAQLINHGYDAGGDIDNGVFSKVDWLLNRHPQLKVTLFATDRKSTRLNSSHPRLSRMPSSA